MTREPEHLLLEAAFEVARLAGDVALSHYRKRLDVETKSDGSPVTVADRAAEREARDWLEKRFPRDGVLGEEYGVTRPEAARRWILDPIDGTKSFVRRVPLWGTLVAVAEGDDVLAGVAYFPAASEIAGAAVGEGCWWNGERARVSTVSELALATVLTTDERSHDPGGWGERWRELTRPAAVSRTWGDCFGYLMVATGRAEVMVDAKMSAWDAAALKPIVEEAGGVFTDRAGKATAFGGSGIATNALLAARVRELLGVGPGGERR